MHGRTLQLDVTSDANTRSICNPTEGDIDKRKYAKKEFCAFVKSTLNELYKIESRCIGGKSSIGIFCRMDIGVVLDSDTKNVSYFVNEVEHTTTTSLWANGGSLPMGTFGTTLAKLFHDWLSDISKI